MVHLYELASDYGLNIPAKFFTDVYLIEKKMEKKTAGTIDILNLMYIINTGNRGKSYKKVYTCLCDFYERNDIQMKII